MAFGAEALASGAGACFSLSSLPPMRSLVLRDHGEPASASGGPCSAQSLVLSDSVHSSFTQSYSFKVSMNSIIRAFPFEFFHGRPRGPF